MRNTHTEQIKNTANKHYGANAVMELPFFNNTVLQWEREHLYAVNKYNPAERRQLKLQKVGSKSYFMLLPQGNEPINYRSCTHKAIHITVSKDNSTATMEMTDIIIKTDYYSPQQNARKEVTKTIKYPKNLRVNWDADNTDLQWERGGRLFAVDRSGSGKIEIPLSTIPIYDGQFVVDMISGDNTLLKIQASRNYENATLSQFDSQNFPVKNGLMVVNKDNATRQENVTNPAIEPLKNLDWVADRGYLQWQPGNRLFLVESKEMSDDKPRRVEVDLKAIRPAGEGITIDITGGRSCVTLEVSGDMKSAALQRLEKPASWESRHWGHEQGRHEYKNNVRDYVTQLNGIDLSWVADSGRLKWQPGNRLFLLDSTSPKKQPRGIEVNIKEVMAQKGRQKNQPGVINLFSNNQPVALEIAADMKSASLRRFTQPESWSGVFWHNPEGVRTTAYNHELVRADLGIVDQIAAFPDRASALAATDVAVPKLFECYRPPVLQSANTLTPS